MNNKKAKEILYKKLGLGSVSLSKEDSIVDDNPSTNRYIRDFKLDIINRGTLRKFKPSIVLRRIFSRPDIDTVTYETYETPLNHNGYDSEIKTNIFIKNQLTFGFFDKYNYNLLDNNFYSDTKNMLKNAYKMPGEDTPYINDFNYELPFVRLGYSGFANINSIEGFAYENEGYSLRSFSNPNIFTGKKTLSINNSFKVWDQSLTNQQYSGFYIPYPTTIDSIKYNGFNIATKIAHDSFLEEDLNGLILISTGFGVNQKVCYISPHGLKTGLSNTFVHNSILFKDKKENIYKNKKIASGIICKTLVLGSQYDSEKTFPKNKGIRFKNSGENSIFSRYDFNKWVDFHYSLDENDFDGGITGSVDFTFENQACLTGFYPNHWVDSLYTVSTDGHMRQTTPLKDTLYYKFYNNIYNGYKKINTGTWDGIIPSGVPFEIELVSCEFNTLIGTKNILNIIYSGYGNNDQTDVRINEAFYLGKIPNTGIRGKGKIIIPENNIFSAYGRANDLSPSHSFLKALKEARFNLFTKFSYVLKNYAFFTLKQNSNLKRLIKRKLKNNYIFNTSDYSVSNSSFICKNNNFINVFPSYIKVTRSKAGSHQIINNSGDQLMIEYLPHGKLYNSSRLDIFFAYGDENNNIEAIQGSSWNNPYRMVRFGKSPNWAGFIWVPPIPDNSTTRSGTNLSPSGARYLNFSIRSSFIGSYASPTPNKYDFVYSLYPSGSLNSSSSSSSSV